MRPDGDLLVAMQIARRRVGDLVVTPLPELVAVLLTMSHTPKDDAPVNAKAQAMPFAEELKRCLRLAA